MGANTKIEWADDTFNGWWGCTEISDACDHCYARELAKRFGKDLWGDKDRELKSDANWGQPLKWQRDADRFEAEYGRKRFVFTASMSDVFDNQVDPAWRARLWDLIRQCDRLIWPILTKRPQNIAKMLPADWGTGWSHVWLGTTVEHQEAAQRNIPVLLQTPADTHFLSCEPLLGELYLRAIPTLGMYFDALKGEYWKPANDGDAHPVNIDDSDRITVNRGRRIKWVIAGGESGRHARPSHLGWFANIRDDCEETRTPFFFKQWGEWAPAGIESASGQLVATKGIPDMRLYRWSQVYPGSPMVSVRVGKTLAGRKLGSFPDEWYHDGRPEA